VAALPNQYNIFDVAPGAQWNTTWTLTNADLTPMNITGKIFEFVIRASPQDLTAPAPVTVTSSASTAQGTIVVNTTAATVQIILNPVATSLLVQVTSWVHALWMDPGLSTATAMVEGAFVVSPVAAP